jgi:hypothetical protein
VEVNVVSPWSNPDVTAQGFKFVIVSVEDSAEGAIQGKTLGDTVLQAETTTLTQHYGFSSEPPENTEEIGLTLRDGNVAAVAENCTRPDLSTGQSQQWDSAGNKITCKDSSGGIDIEARSGQSVATLSPTLLGSLAAAIKLLKGTTVKTAISAFLVSWQSAITTALAAPPTDAAVIAYLTALQTAITTLQGTESTWESTKHKLDA